MTPKPTQKDNLIEFINAFAAAKASGNQTLITMSLNVLDIQLATLPDNWAAPQDEAKQEEPVTTPDAT